MIEFARRCLERYAKRPSWIRWTAVLAWASLIWFASSSSTASRESSLFWDFAYNGAHVVVFGVLAALLYLVLRGDSNRRAALAIAFAACYGLGDEVHQAYTPGRHPSAYDVLSDVVGAACFTAGAVWLVERRRRALWIACGLTPAALGAVALATF